MDWTLILLGVVAIAGVGFGILRAVRRRQASKSANPNDIYPLW
ncbi:hypothetical protein [Pyruvatibacter sp.]